MENTTERLNKISTELYDLISTQFPDITLGDEQAKIVTDPVDARFFDFTYRANELDLGKVSVALNDKSITVIYKKDITAGKPVHAKESWYNFLRKIRKIANINRLSFDVRDIDKSSLSKRDYEVLSSEQFKGNAMSESKFYGTSRRSYLNIGEARLVIKHSQQVNQEMSGSRSQHVESIYIESKQGERFKYPIKHLGGAKAMARHVSEGGNQYDDFGKYIVGLSEELSSLGKFKRYMNRGGVMAESLAGYVDTVNERVTELKKTVEKLQRENFYRETFDSFEQTILEEVPTDVAENWIDQLTIRQFNEELKGVFPYIYRLVSEATKAKMVGPDELVSEFHTKAHHPGKKPMKNTKSPDDMEIESTFESMMGQFGEATPDQNNLAKSVNIVRELIPIARVQGERWTRMFGPNMPWPLVTPSYSRIGAMLQQGGDPTSLVQQEIQKIKKLQNFIKQNSQDTKNQVHRAIKTLLQNPNILQVLQHMETKLGQLIGPAVGKTDGPVAEAGGDTSSVGYITIRLGKKTTGGEEKTPYLVAYAGHVTDAKELTYDKAISKASPILNAGQLRTFISRVLNSEKGEPHAAGKPPGAILAISESIKQAFPFISEVEDWISTRNQKNIKVEILTKDEKPVDNRIDVVHNKPKNKGGYNPQEVVPAEKTPTTYFSIKNPRLMDHIRQTDMKFMREYYRPNIKEFVMGEKDFNQFMKTVKGGEYRAQFGDPGIEIDIERSFIESTNLEEGLKDKLKILALLGLVGMGGHMAFDAISAKHSPLGKALAVAAQQGDEDAAEYLSNLDGYIEGNDTGTLEMLKFKYMDEPESMKKEDQHGPNCNCQTDECSCGGGGDDDQMQEPPETKVSIGDFILSFYDRNTGNFPKGETSVLTMVEKEYGDKYVPVATEFINKVHGIHEKFSGMQSYNESEIDRIRSLAGV